MAEAEELAEQEVRDLPAMERAAATIGLRGVKHVLVKGGRLTGATVDVLWSEGEIHRFAADRVATKHTHGTGCVFSAAITARLARGESLLGAIHGAKAFVTDAIRRNPQLGSGYGPINMHADVPPAANEN
jgi:hydroxymethylpyrimidine/phosphomethylpyrimidine kinase